MAEWFNALVVAGRILVCDAVILELIRVTPNGRRAAEVVGRLDALPSVPMPAAAWSGARQLQLKLASAGAHRSTPPVDLLIAACAEAAAVPLLHYDRDYERIAAVSSLDARWFVPDGSLA